MALDSLPPPPDLDVPASREAARLYRMAVARKVPEDMAWEEAVRCFALHHPAWPWPLAEREAARAVGALLTVERGGEGPAYPVPPLALLRALGEPEMASPRGMVEEGPMPFRRVWRFPMGKLPPLRLPVPAQLALPPC